MMNDFDVNNIDNNGFDNNGFDNNDINMKFCGTKRYNNYSTYLKFGFFSLFLSMIIQRTITLVNAAKKHQIESILSLINTFVPMKAKIFETPKIHTFETFEIKVGITVTIKYKAPKYPCISFVTSKS